MGIRSFIFGAIASLCCAAYADQPTVRIQIDSSSPSLTHGGLNWALGKHGKLLHKSGNRLTIEVRSEKPHSLVQRLRRTSGVIKVTPMPPNGPTQITQINSVKGVKEKLEEYEEAYEAYYKAAHGDNAKIEGEIPGTDYLEAYLYYIERRAYPNDSINWASINETERTRNFAPPAGRLGPQTGVELSGDWQFIGPRNLSIPYKIYYGNTPLGGRINAVAIDPTASNTYWVGAAGGGVWKSTDSGITWNNVSLTWQSQRINSIAIHPQNGNIVYVGTGDKNGGIGPGFGIRKSVDGGQNWTTIGTNEFGGKAVKKIVIDPETPTTITVAAGGWGGAQIYRSTNSGATWSTVTMPAPAIRDWNGMAMGARDTAGNRIMMAVADDGAIAKSTDRGQTWTDLTFPVTIGHPDVAASPVNPNAFYVIEANSETIHKTVDGGTTWTDTTTDFPGGYNWSQAWYDMHIECSSNLNTDIVYVGLIDVVQSINGGTNWRNFGRSYFGNSILHNDQHSFCINPQNPDEGLIGNDGGTWKWSYSPSGDSWAITPVNKELGGTTLFYDADWHPTDGSYMIGGTQDNAAPAALGDINNWKNPGAGDGGFQAINQQNPANQYTTSQGLGMSKTNNYWVTSQGISPNLNGQNVPFIGVIYADPNDGNKVYALTNYVNRYNNSGGGWTYRLGNQDMGNGGVISSIAIPKGDSSRIYVGSRGKVYMSADSGSTWTDVSSGGLPNRVITDIDVNPNNADDVIVTCGGSGAGHVFRTQNIQSSTRVWSNRTTNLPDSPANCIAIDPDDPLQTWYVGTDIGVFVTEDGGANWADATLPLGLPVVSISELQVVPATRSLYAATYGRGIWRIDVGVNVVESFTISPNNGIGGLTPVVGIIKLLSAQATDTTFTVTASPTTTVLIPATVTIPAGNLQAIFDIGTRPTQGTVNTKITITSTVGQKAANLLLRPIGLANPLTVWPGRLPSGNVATCYVNLEAPAPTGGASVYLTTTRPDLAWPERNWVLVPEGQTQTRVRIYTRSVDLDTVVYVKASRAGTTVQNDLTLMRASISSVSTTTNVTRGGNTLTGTVTLDAPAGVNGAVVRLSSSNTSAATVPATVVVPPGYRTVSFNITTYPVASNVAVSITGTYFSTTKSLNLTVVP